MSLAPRPKPGLVHQPKDETAAPQAWVGRRVVIRSKVPGEAGPSGGPALTDAVGVVEAADEREVVVRRRDGSTRRIACEDIVVVKAVPPAPPRRRPRVRREDPG